LQDHAVDLDRLLRLIRIGKAAADHSRRFVGLQCQLVRVLMGEGYEGESSAASLKNLRRDGPDGQPINWKRAKGVPSPPCRAVAEERRTGEKVRMRAGQTTTFPFSRPATVQNGVLSSSGRCSGVSEERASQIIAANECGGLPTRRYADKFILLS
jgi:hypothetical protein